MMMTGVERTCIRDVVSVLTSRSRDATSRLGLVSTKIQRLGLDYLPLVPNTLFCSNFASHINKMSQINSRYYGSVDTNRNRSMHHLRMEVTGWWSDVMVLTCSFAIASKIRPILTYRWRNLNVSSRLVRPMSRALTSRAHPWQGCGQVAISHHLLNKYVHSVACCPLVSHVESAPHALLRLVKRWDRRTDARPMHYAYR